GNVGVVINYKDGRHGGSSGLSARLGPRRPMAAVAQDRSVTRRLVGVGEDGALRRAAMGFTKGDEPLRGRGDSGLRRGRYLYLAGTNGVGPRRDHSGGSV